MDYIARSNCELMVFYFLLGIYLCDFTLKSRSVGKTVLNIRIKYELNLEFNISEYSS